MAGLSLANLVANQHWMSRIFAPSAIATGGANVDSAIEQVVMPIAYNAVVLHLGVPVIAWCITYLLPCAMLIISGLAVLAFPYDLPRGFACGSAAVGLDASFSLASMPSCHLRLSPPATCLLGVAEHLKLSRLRPPST
ncbi:hypothetical protein E2562_031822, partial [Oryza meyeriana var. granulata]